MKPTSRSRVEVGIAAIGNCVNRRALKHWWGAWTTLNPSYKIFGSALALPQAPLVYGHGENDKWTSTYTHVTINVEIFVGGWFSWACKPTKIKPAKICAYQELATVIMVGYSHPQNIVTTKVSMFMVIPIIIANLSQSLMHVFHSPDVAIVRMWCMNENAKRLWDSFEALTCQS